MLLTDRPDELALYNGVLANPLDEAPRLILADWYEENGYEWRANWIKGVPAYLGNNYREDIPQCFDWYRSRVKTSLMDKCVLRWAFDRGFVATITIGDMDWLYHHKSLLAWHPLQEVNIEAMAHRHSSGPFGIRYFRSLTKDSNPWLKVQFAHPI